jgi:hypothetical protein
MIHLPRSDDYFQDDPGNRQDMGIYSTHLHFTDGFSVPKTCGKERGLQAT